MLVNVFIFIMGAVFGSFLNVCIYRLPKEESIVFPSSHCPECNTPIKLFDNIPIISYILLKGKCRACLKPISIRYPTVEFITGCAFLSAHFFKGLSPDFFFWCVFLCLFIIGFFTDLREQIIPDEIIWVGLLVGIIYLSLNGKFMESIIAAASGYTVFLVIAKLGEFWFKKEALGYGDLKLGAMLGSILGLSGFWNTFMLAYVFGAGITILLLILKIKKMGDYVPFGPFLIAGAVFTLFLGPKLLLAVF